MCKTAYQILIERSAKFCDLEGRKLEVFFEECGKHEDRDIISYTRELKTTGSFFNEDNSGRYDPLIASEYKRIVLGEPRRKTKKVSMIQVADLFLYPMAKGGYDPGYRAYTSLLENNMLIDCFLTEEEVESKGIKYSCFEK